MGQLKGGGCFEGDRTGGDNGFFRVLYCQGTLYIREAHYQIWLFKLFEGILGRSVEFQPVQEI